AVDPSYIPYESVIFIPKARGVNITLPDGATVKHDGYFFAADTGGAIKENHIDVFAGVTRTNPFPGFIKSNISKTFEAFLINDPTIYAPLAKLHNVKTPSVMNDSDHKQSSALRTAFESIQVLEFLPEGQRSQYYDDVVASSIDSLR